MGKTIIKAALILLLAASIGWAGGCKKSCAVTSQEKEISPVETVLKQLNQKVSELQSYQCRIEYLFSQPLLESETLRKGILYYARFNGKTVLRINFQTLKQDDEKEEKYIEHFIFDGVWLTRVDYQIKTVERRQLAEPNKPIDAFDLVRSNFPLIGFGRGEDLKKEFEIKLVEQQGGKAGDFVQLHLIAKPDSVYKDDYTSIDFWIDKKVHLPAKIVAVSTEEDIYRLKFLKAEVNKKVEKEVFEFKIPRDFSKEVIPLKAKKELNNQTQIFNK